MSFLSNLASKSELNEEVREFLKFTWFGDLACSSGPHYEFGERRPFQEIVTDVEKGHSDDLVENLACWALKEGLPQELSISSLFELCRRFQGLIEEHYEQMPIRYSPDYPDLFDAETLDEYYRVIIDHSNCGGAMRSGLLGYGGVSDRDHLALVAMTHLHPEAVSGAFAVAYAVRAAKEGSSAETIREEAIGGAHAGLAAAEALIAESDYPLPSIGGIAERMERVFAADDPLWSVEDMEAEGIETHFVIPAALLLALRVVERPPASPLRYLVEETIAIGGDPDTIGSISMGVTGAYLGESLSTEIDAVLVEYDFDPALVPPFLETPLG